MNRVTLMGRITKDLELKRTQNGKVMLNFTVAVNRPKSEADFIRCTAWGKTAEFIQSYFGKGNMIAVEGNIRAGNYTDNSGTNRYMMNVCIDKVFFTGEKNENKSQGNYKQNNYQQNGRQNTYNYNQNNGYYNNNQNGYNGYGY